MVSLLRGMHTGQICPRSEFEERQNKKLRMPASLQSPRPNETLRGNERGIGENPRSSRTIAAGPTSSKEVVTEQPNPDLQRAPKQARRLAAS
jgi:hypothetical protein